MTGAVLPEGADCVVPYEETAREGDWMSVLASAEPAAAGRHVHRRGSDHAAGDVIVRAGVRLTGREIAVAASCGHPALTVTHSPKIAVISTGDELVEVDSLVAPHQIRRSNDYAICGPPSSRRAIPGPTGSTCATSGTRSSTCSGTSSRSMTSC